MKNDKPQTYTRRAQTTDVFFEVCEKSVQVCGKKIRRKNERSIAIPQI